MKNNNSAPLPFFSSHTTMAALQVWSWGPVDKERKRLASLLGAIAYLNGHDLCGAGVIGAYHSRRVAPLMARELLLYGMAPGVRLEGTLLAQGLLQDSEIQQRI